MNDVDLLEAYDQETYLHCKRVSEIAAYIGTKCHLDDENVQMLRQAGNVHDIGKIFLPNHILMKETPLTEKERSLIETHPYSGYLYLIHHGFNPRICQLTLSHHRKPTGVGYPEPIIKKELHMEEQILMAADIYDAMTSDRVYRKALPKEEALKEIESCGVELSILDALIML